MSFSVCVSVLIFCLVDLYIVLRGVLNSPTIILFLSIFTFMVVTICLYVLRLFLCWVNNFFLLYLVYGLIPWSFVVSFFVFCNSFQFKIYFILYKYSYSHCRFPFVWNNFLHCLTLRLCLSLDLDWVPCRHQLLGSIFGIHSASLRLLVTSLDPFTVIIGVHFPITNYFIPLCFCRSAFSLVFLFQKSFFSIRCEARFVVLNSFSFAYVKGLPMEC